MPRARQIWHGGRVYAARCLLYICECHDRSLSHHNPHIEWLRSIPSKSMFTSDCCVVYMTGSNTILTNALHWQRNRSRHSCMRKVVIRLLWLLWERQFLRSFGHSRATQHIFVALTCDMCRFALCIVATRLLFAQPDWEKTQTKFRQQAIYTFFRYEKYSLHQTVTHARMHSIKWVACDFCLLPVLLAIFIWRRKKVERSGSHLTRLTTLHFSRTSPIRTIHRE